MTEIPSENKALSFQSAQWVLPDIGIDQAERIAKTHDIPEIVARILAGRGFAEDAIGAFINPKMATDFPDPFTMADMRALAEYMADAIDAKRNIAIFGDFDVDGATSSALLYRFLKHCGVKAPIYIPDRLTEGYGPNVVAFEKLKTEGAEIVIVLDCGTAAFETIAKGKSIGLDIVIVDHHEPETTLPDAVHVLNPKRKDDTSGLENLAAVGVTFMLCVAVNSVLRTRGFFTQNGIEEAPLKSWLDIVALGTVCDMVPLEGVNRLFVRYGFRGTRPHSYNTGIQALMNVAGLDEQITPYHAGYILGPRINAGSRVHKSDLGAKLLATDSPQEAQDIAFSLNDCNEKRKALQQSMEEQAIAQIESSHPDTESLPAIVAVAPFEDGELWHTGLSGLVAGRLKEKYKKPACVISFVKTGDGGLEGRGSGRSVSGVHIAQCFMDAKEEGILLAGGGHAMAGGFSLKPENLEAFKAFVNQHIQKQSEGTISAAEALVDSVLSVHGVNLNIVKSLRLLLGPFGQSNDEPLFLFKNVKLWSADVVGGSHIRALISDWEGGARIKAMAFRAVDTPLGDALLKQGKASFDILGTLKVNAWNGRESAEMHIQDARFSNANSEDVTVKRVSGGIGG